MLTVSKIWGVTSDSELLFKDHIYDKMNKAYQMIGIISRNFKELDKYTFTMLYKSMVRSHFEYANSVCGVRTKNIVLKILRRFRREQQN